MPSKKFQLGQIVDFKTPAFSDGGFSPPFQKCVACAVPQWQAPGPALHYHMESNVFMLLDHLVSSKVLITLNMQPGRVGTVILFINNVTQVDSIIIWER